MALALDGSVHGNNASASSISVSLTTSNADDVICAVVTTNTTGVTSVSSSNTTGWARRAQGGSSGQRIELWYGVGSSALSLESIAINTASAGYLTVDVFGISGADTTQIWDANGALPSVGTSGNRSITTTSGDTFLIGGYRMTSIASPTQGSGWTKISGADYQLVEYQIVSSTQSGLSVTIGTGHLDQNGGVADAVVLDTGGGGGGGSPWYYRAQQAIASMRNRIFVPDLGIITRAGNSGLLCAANDSSLRGVA